MIRIFFIIFILIVSACNTENPIIKNTTIVTSGNADGFLIVDCLLPGQVRKLGRISTYITARRPIKTSIADCEIRGGEYVAYDRSNYATALKVWLAQAKSGNPKAQTYVGEIYEKGLGVPANYQKAAEWYQKAADQNYSSAQMNLGFLYEKGLGVKQDTRISNKWYNLAAGLSEKDFPRRDVEVDTVETNTSKTCRGTILRCKTSNPPELTREKGLPLGNYYALIIGNNQYQHLPKLKTAINDAKAVDKLLKQRYGYQTNLLLNATRFQILETLNQLRSRLTEKDNLLIYYAGHGELDKVNQRGNWLPVDANPESTTNWISNIQLTDIVNAMSSKHILIVADSCYSGAMTRSALSRLNAGMSSEKYLKWIRKMLEKQSRTVLTSGGLKPVLDSGGGQHSIFAKAFLDTLERNNDILEGYKLYRQVASLVNDASAANNFEQVPEYAPLKYAKHEAGEFFFVPLKALP
jgi:hypothetical protein